MTEQNTADFEIHRLQVTTRLDMSYTARIGALGLWVGGLMVRIISNVVFAVLLL